MPIVNVSEEVVGLGVGGCKGVGIPSVGSLGLNPGEKTLLVLQKSSPKNFLQF